MLSNRKIQQSEFSLKWCDLLLIPTSSLQALLLKAETLKTIYHREGAINNAGILG